MNERIEQLKSQCWVEKRWDNDMWIEKHIDLEKFAELIVQECADICYHHSNAAGGVDTHFGYGYKDCGDDIKRNFGVEE
jgi:hypothetical protein